MFKKSKDFGFKDFLSESLDKGNKMNDKELNKFESCFLKTIGLIINSFGPQAFAKYKFENEKLRLQSTFNAAVYDSVAISVYSEIIKANKTIDQKMKNKFKKLFEKEQFYESVSGSILDSAKIVYRIDEARNVFR